jgi:hypothetical protein
MATNNKDKKKLTFAGMGPDELEAMHSDAVHGRETPFTAAELAAELRRRHIVRLSDDTAKPFERLRDATIRKFNTMLERQLFGKRIPERDELSAIFDRLDRDVRVLANLLQDFKSRLRR